MQARRGDSQPVGDNVIFVGQSLGTGVGSRIVEQLTKAGTPPSALVLIAPYLSLRRMVADYHVGGIIPVLAPVFCIPYANRLLDWGLKTTFASDRALPSLYATLDNPHSPPWPHLIISHATDDEVIPFAQGERASERAAFRRLSIGADTLRPSRQASSSSRRSSGRTLSAATQTVVEEE